MLKRWAGCVPLLALIVGSCCALYAGLAVLMNVSQQLQTSFTDNYNDKLVRLFGLVVYYLIPAAPFIIIGLIIAQAIPFIKIEDKGIYYWTPFTIVPRLLSWDEISGYSPIGQIPQFMILVISRKDANLFDSQGLGLNYVYGIFIGKIAPVLFVFANREQRVSIVSHFPKQTNSHHDG